ncbi:dienelactone hydrolase family protein [Klebsiella variicola subsp. variicola]|nr:dienelactone hydrolase family protein [Klebsiella variicola subsp. variicola]
MNRATWRIPSGGLRDIRCAVDYINTLSFIHPDKIGVLGICAGAGYAISAATTDRRIKAIAGVSGTDAGAAIREGWDGNLTAEEQIHMLEAVSAQRTAEIKGATVRYMPYVPETVDEGTSVTMREAHDYYRTPVPGIPDRAIKS